MRRDPQTDQRGGGFLVRGGEKGAQIKSCENREKMLRHIRKAEKKIALTRKRLDASWTNRSKKRLGRDKINCLIERRENSKILDQQEERRCFRKKRK